MTAFFIDAFFGYFVWLVLILIIYAVIKLVKRESLKTLNFKMVFLLSLIGVIPAVLGLISGSY
jgi:uncharacterized membrane protein